MGGWGKRAGRTKRRKGGVLEAERVGGGEVVLIVAILVVVATEAGVLDRVEGGTDV